MTTTQTTNQNTEAAKYAVVPAGGEFAVTDMTTGEVISRHFNRAKAEVAAVTYNYEGAPEVGCHNTNHGYFLANGVLCDCAR